MRPDPRRSVHQPARMPPLPPTSSDPPAYSTNVSWASSGIFPTCMQAWRPVPDGSCEAHCLLVWHSTPAQYIHPSRTPHPTSAMGDRQVVRPLACENSTTLQQRFALSIHGTYRTSVRGRDQTGPERLRTRYTKRELKTHTSGTFRGWARRSDPQPPRRAL